MNNKLLGEIFLHFIPFHKEEMISNRHNESDVHVRTQLGTQEDYPIDPLQAVDIHEFEKDW
jgi:hypothetical protein